VDRTAVRVGDDTLAGRHVLIATGMQPAPLGIPGEAHLTTSEQFLELDRLPQRIAFVGGGYISFEFAHVAARAGAQARILHRGARPLPGFDPDLVDQLVQATRDLGVDVQLNASVRAIEQTGGELLVRVSGAAGAAGAPGGGGEQTFAADLVVHGAGRVPEIDNLDLEQAGIQRERRGVSVNEHLQSVSNPAVYAAGDSAATAGLPLTPVAALEGEVAAANLLEGNHRRPDYAGVPTVVFTIPALASVGLQEAAARERGLKFRKQQEETAEWYSSRRVALPRTGFKVLVEEGSGRILGAHLLGPHAEEVVNLFGLAIRKGLTAADLEEMPYAYPTSASDLWYMV
jgi:glutathione reductase (NADPH)